MILVLGGVSGSGKSRVGHRLAESTGGTFFDGDDFHPPANKEKMRRQQPLTDEDRLPWLESMAQLLKDRLVSTEPTILACSALKPEYRAILRVDPKVKIALLDVPREALIRRLASRKGHFFPPELLDSQLRTLVRPANEPNTRIIDGDRPIDQIAQDLVTWGTSES